ncbi:MAG: hypothetical protein ACRD0P_04005 [Stackebrandtia sp.]
MNHKVDRLDRMVVRAVSPDGRIHGRLHSNGDVDFEFRDPDFYYDYSAGDLARQLTQLLQGMKNARDAVVVGELGSGEPNLSLLDGRRRRYHEELEHLISYGVSRSGGIEVSANGPLRQQRVDIDDEALAEADLEEFLVELHAAYADMRRDYRTQRRALNREHYSS